VSRQRRLVRIEEDAARSPINCGFHIRIRENDDGRFTAKLQRRAFQVAGCRLENELADLGRSGERDLVDTWMIDESRSGGFPEPGHDVDHTLRKSDFLRELAEPDG